MSSDSTNIDSLPMQTSENIQLNVSDQPVNAAIVPNVQQTVPQQQIQQQTPQQQQALASPSPPSIVPNEVNSITSVVQGLQEAQQQGATRLNSRDIPMNTSNIMQDKQVQPNFIPEETGDYIEEQNVYDSMQQKKIEQQKRDENIDYLYDEFQLPILIMVLFFIFQLPFTRNKFIALFPNLFKRDGNITMWGYIVKTLLFGSCFYLIVKVTKYASEY